MNLSTNTLLLIVKGLQKAYLKVCEKDRKINNINNRHGNWL